VQTDNLTTRTTAIAAPITTQHTVEHKWSCWSCDVSTWEEVRHGPAFLADLASLLVEGSHIDRVIVTVTSRKEIRSGIVSICAEERDGQRGLRAVGSLYEEWDDPEDLANTLAVDEDRLRPLLPFGSFSNPSPGIEMGVDAFAPTVEGLLVEVDLAESELIQRSAQAWRDLIARARALADEDEGPATPSKARRDPWSPVDRANAITQEFRVDFARGLGCAVPVMPDVWEALPEGARALAAIRALPEDGRTVVLLHAWDQIDADRRREVSLYLWREEGRIRVRGDVTTVWPAPATLARWLGKAEDYVCRLAPWPSEADEPRVITRVDDEVTMGVYSDEIDDLLYRLHGWEDRNVDDHALRWDQFLAAIAGHPYPSDDPQPSRGRR
jgi:hypothetical protein